MHLALSALISWYQPTVEDFTLLQNYLHEDPRPELEWVKEYSPTGQVVNTRRYRQLRAFNFVDPSFAEVPKLQLELFNTTLDDKECCIITYSSWNKPYTSFPDQIKKALQTHGYKGHFVHQVGGFPYVDGGSLSLFDTPYAFKICMFQEAKRLGYRYVLWIDVSLIPEDNLEEIFKELALAKGLFLKDTVAFSRRFFSFTLQQNQHIVSALGTTFQDLVQCDHLNARLIGLDLFEPKNIAFLDKWYELAKEKTAFFSPSPEQIPMSYLAHKLGIIGVIHSQDWLKTHFNLLFHAAPIINPLVHINDWFHPRVEDFITLQEYLEKGERPELRLAIEYTIDGKIHDRRRATLLRNFRFVDHDAIEVPKLQLEVFHTTPDDKRHCIITYCSWNKPYIYFPEKIKEALAQQGFSGHFLYQVGGFPYTDEGSLHYFDVPYAFKMCMFQEAKRLGYEKVIWIDVSAIPKTDLSEVFTELDRVKGLFLFDMLPFKWGGLRYILEKDPTITTAMGTSWKEMRSCHHLNGKLIGLDLRNKKNLEFLEAWYAMAEKKIPFCNMSVEQIPLSYLAKKFGIIGNIHTDAWFYEKFDLQPH